MRFRFALPWFALCAAVSVSAAVPPQEFLESYCIDCHSADTAKAEIRLDTALELDWRQHKTFVLWERVLNAMAQSEMPPKKKRHQPSAGERQAAIREIRTLLAKNSPVGGSVLRRLNRAEYENTVRKVFRVPFKAPLSFPADSESHGFDNVGEGLTLSPPLMEQYFEVATAVADLLIAPARDIANISQRTVALQPGDFSVNFEGSKVKRRNGGEVMRLVTKDEVLVRSGTWPTRFEAKIAGRYRVKLRASAFRPTISTPLKLELRAKPASAMFFSSYSLPELATLEVPVDGRVKEFDLEVPLERGQSVALRWADSDFGWNRGDRDTARRHLSNQFHNRSRYAAWLKMGVDRGRTPAEAWATMKRLMAGDDLDLADPRLRKLAERYNSVDQNSLMWLFENMRQDIGPGLDIHGMTVTGPVSLIEGREEKEQRLRTERFLGQRQGRSDGEYARALLAPLIENAFRRPPTGDQITRYLKLAANHQASGHGFEDGIHLALRALLCSPDFLYRESRPGPLDRYDLASRLSYFLTGGPPESKLYRLAGAGQLSDPKTLETETRRLLKDRASRQFLDSFLGQWLDLRLLPEIMPDPRLGRFTAKNLNAIRNETEMFVGEILRKNLPLETFIDPGFTYLNKRNAPLYGIRYKGGDDMKRVALKKGGRFGGILGQASIMMATANGVDTQPVLRGVWMLENIFGEPPPPPPSNVPAIEPDTSGANSIRDLLQRHRSDPNCASCHRRIDPIGFAMENFDPIGRWRDHYPIYQKTGEGTVKAVAGLRVDSQSTMTDGTEIKDVTDLKRYLVAHIDKFSRCLTEKLLIYATGRPMSYGDQQIIEQIVKDVKAQGNGFQDLIVAVVKSQAFAVR
jgi:hypothetical protein